MVDESFRNYRAEARASVRELYRLNHRFQTVEFVRAKQAEFLPKARRVMGIWEAMEFLNTLVDDSDPDIDLSQRDHLLQTSEAIRADGHRGRHIERVGEGCENRQGTAHRHQGLERLV